jgi:hypothetical protein
MPAIYSIIARCCQVFKKPDPKELVRKWQADLRAEQRKIDRQIRGEALIRVVCSTL